MMTWLNKIFRHGVWLAVLGWLVQIAGAQSNAALNLPANACAALAAAGQIHSADIETNADLARCTLFEVQINPEMRVKVNAGPAPAELVVGEWQFFLVRIQNDSGTTAPLQLSVLNPEPWLAAEVVATTNLPALSGAALEYRIVKLRSLEEGKREARISLHVGQGTQDLGFRNEVDILFDCRTKPSATANQPSSSTP